jgi:hypothetical protein
MTARTRVGACTAAQSESAPPIEAPPQIAESTPSESRRQQHVFALLRIRVVLDPLEFLRQAMPARVWKDPADRAEERLEVADHHRRIFDRSAVDPHDRRACGIAGFAPVQQNSVGEVFLRQS